MMSMKLCVTTFATQRTTLLASITVAFIYLFSGENSNLRGTDLPFIVPKTYCLFKNSVTILRCKNTVMTALRTQNIQYKHTIFIL